MLCRHYETSKGCVYKDKCQFAHGTHELRSANNVLINNKQVMQDSMQGNPLFAHQLIQQNMPVMGELNQNPQKKIPNPQNYKIVKCKNYEKGLSIIKIDGYCKYEGFCSFAHGDSDLRKKNENSFLQMPMNPQMMQVYPQVFPQELGMMYNPYQMGMVQQPMDLNQIYGFPQPIQNLGNLPNMQGMGYPMGYGNEALFQGNPNDQLKDQENSGNSNLSNLNTINNVIYQPKFQK